MDTCPPRPDTPTLDPSAPVRRVAISNTSRFGSFLCLLGGLFGTLVALWFGFAAAFLVLTSMTFLLGLTVLHAGLRQDHEEARRESA
ncbi:hypothetical protein [Micromonospora sp. DT47]|uniref:hypothetical protein n=1 Tax=Micromonospora sp. DT47 TaxID=3393431 RepID=UPI003CF394B0